MPETKTPQKFPPEKGLRPSLHPTDDVQKVLEEWGEEYLPTKTPEELEVALIKLATLAFEAGQKSERERFKVLLDAVCQGCVDIERLKAELSK